MEFESLYKTDNVLLSCVVCSVLLAPHFFFYRPIKMLRVVTNVTRVRDEDGEDARQNLLIRKIRKRSKTIGTWAHMRFKSR